MVVFSFVGACGGGGEGGGGSLELPSAPDTSNLAELVDDDTRSRILAAESARASDTSSSSAWAKLGRSYEAASLESQAETCYLAASLLEPGEPRHHWRAAISAERQGEHDRAFEHLDRVLALAPDYGPAWRRAALWRLESGDINGARKAVARAEPLLGLVPDAFVVKARIALLADDLDGALEAAREAHRRAPKDPYVRLILGEALRRKGEVHEASPHLTAGRGSTPSFVDPWSESASRERSRDTLLVEEGRRLESEGRLDEALQRYDEVLLRRPDDSNVLHRKGVTLLAANRGVEALVHLNEAHHLLPGDFDIAVARIGALSAAGEKAEARRSAEELISQFPRRPSPYLALGQLLGDDGEIDAARAQFAQAARLVPGDVRPPMLEGRLLIQANRFQEAVDVLSQGLNIEGVRPPIPYFSLLLGAQARAGETEPTIRATYERAREIHGEAAHSLLKQR